MVNCSLVLEMNGSIFTLLARILVLDVYKSVSRIFFQLESNILCRSKGNSIGDRHPVIIQTFMSS